jgi:CspA family cold shock protein
MTQGTVKWFSGERGFGFVKPDDGSADVFVHISAIERAGMHAFDVGDQVAFEVVTDQRSGKPAADNLRAA